MPAGYSGTPLYKKLGLKEGMKIIVHAPPKPYTTYFTYFPDHIRIQKTSKSDNIDFIHIFCKRIHTLEKIVHTLKPSLKKTGTMWISWPKGSSKTATDAKREPIRTLMLRAGLVDVKVCAVDDDWSGLKFVYRLKDR